MRPNQARQKRNSGFPRPYPEVASGVFIAVRRDSAQTQPLAGLAALSEKTELLAFAAVSESWLLLPWQRTEVGANVECAGSSQSFSLRQLCGGEDELQGKSETTRHL